MATREKITALDIAEYIVNLQSIDDKLEVSHLKLQKLVYYCQAYHLAALEKPLFSDEIEAWVYGPVVQRVYDKYKIFGNHNIDASSDSEALESIKELKAKSLALISAVLETYGYLSPIAIMQRTHREDPWIEAYDKGVKTPIKQESMQAYYKQFLTTANEKK